MSVLYPDHLLSDTFVGQDSESPSISCLHNNNHLQPYSRTSPIAKHTQDQPDPGLVPVPVSSSAKRRLSVERSLSSEDQPQSQQPQQSSVKPARVYTISREGGMLGARGSDESLELEVIKGPQARPNHQRSNHRSGHAHHHHAPSSQPLKSSGSAHNIRDWGSRRSGSREDCPRPPCHSQRSLDLDMVPKDDSKQRKKLERMYSEDQVSTEERGEEQNKKIHTEREREQENPARFTKPSVTPIFFLFMCKSQPFFIPMHVHSTADLYLATPQKKQI